MHVCARSLFAEKIPHTVYCLINGVEVLPRIPLVKMGKEGEVPSFSFPLYRTLACDNSIYSPSPFPSTHNLSPTLNTRRNRSTPGVISLTAIISTRWIVGICSISRPERRIAQTRELECMNLEVQVLHKHAFLLEPGSHEL